MVLVWLTPLFAVAQHTAMVTVIVDSIVQPTGKIELAVFNSNENFKNSVPFKTSIKNVRGTQAKASFTLPVYNWYAIALFQDLNDNDSLDTRGSMKIPTEPFGFSNNKKGTFGPPGFDQVKFMIITDTTISIHLISSRKSYFQKGN